MKLVIIMRGLPGSGKSTLVKAYQRLTTSHEVCSADDYFMGPDGYQFDARKLSAAHTWCSAKFWRALQRGTELVIVDNTNTQHWEFTPYKLDATDAGYDVRVVDVYDGGLSDRELAERNQHGVAEGQIAAMRARWQK